jgi:hypothetical protein
MLCVSHEYAAGPNPLLLSVKASGSCFNQLALMDLFRETAFSLYLQCQYYMGYGVA